MTRYICMLILMVFFILSCSTVKTEKVEMSDRIEKVSHSQETDTITKAIFLFNNYENSIHHVDHHPYIDDDDDDNDVLASSSVSSSSIRQRLIQSNDKDTVSSSSLKPYTLFETVD